MATPVYRYTTILSVLVGVLGPKTSVDILLPDT